MIISFLRGDKRVDSSTNSAFYVMAQNVYFWNDWRQLLKCWICPIYSWTVYLFINFSACYGSKLLLVLVLLLLLLLLLLYFFSFFIIPLFSTASNGYLSWQSKLLAISPTAQLL